LIIISRLSVTACHVVLLQSFRLQRRVVLYTEKWSGQRACELVAKYNVSHVCLVCCFALCCFFIWDKRQISVVQAPSAMTGDVVRELLRGARCPSLLDIGGGGAPRPEHQVQEITRLGLQPGIGWGMTETNGRVMVVFCVFFFVFFFDGMFSFAAYGCGFGGAFYLSRPRACGRFSPLLGWRLSAEGELLVRGGGVVSQYWPDKRATDEEGWLHTGDLAAVDAEGFVEIVVPELDCVVCECCNVVHDREGRRK
jgi:acyl-CoA synthetase (AMP-forming)/AMP-acid ligase II